MTTIRATFTNLDEITRRLRAVGAASESVFRQAAEAGARVVQNSAISNAPGPSIGVEVEVESSTRVVASVGPLKDNWYYKFFEFGTKAHKAKATSAKRFKRYLNKIGRADLAASEPVPMMSWGQGGQAIFAKRVRGVAKKPFLEPAIQNVDGITAAVGDVYMRAILEKTG
jgi:HK97 gp10 family phage protein